MPNVFAPSSDQEAARDLLLDLHHASILLGLVIGEGYVWVAREAQHIVLQADAD